MHHDISLISTIAGTGTPGYNADNIDATTALINTPCGMVIDTVGRIIFADGLNHRIRMLTPVDDTSVDEGGARGSITAYPSPAMDVLHVRSTNTGLLDLVDAHGRVVRRTRVGRDVAAIALTGLVAGLYTVQMEGAVPVRVVALVVDPNRAPSTGMSPSRGILVVLLPTSWM